VILGLVAWYVFALGREERELMQARRGREDRLFRLSTGFMHFALLQILIGALVAGIDAGRTYTDWPLMSGRFLPPDMMELKPWWRNLFENPGTVQFIHRMSGYLLCRSAVANAAGNHDGALHCALATGDHASIRGGRALGACPARAFPEPLSARAIHPGGMTWRPMTI
jgi:heme A synthase